MTFHSGEIAVQERAGERAIAVRREALVVERLNVGMQAFLSTQQVAAVGLAAPDGSLWASLWGGAPGFLLGNADGDMLTIRSDRNAHPFDPVRCEVRPRQPLGVLVIDLDARQRLRINGIAGDVSESGVAMLVTEAFGNCPKYIKRRVHRQGAVTGAAQPSPACGTTLDAERREFIEQSDTCFVASAHPARGVDVSHRGGARGFVQVTRDDTLRIPDYPGNSMFQTLGNLAVDSRAGITFVDFDRGHALAASGHAVATFGDEDAPGHPAGGTGRYWSFTVSRWLEFAMPWLTTWTLVDQSPFNP
jgi:predicted pyridoxine 5'-phosphate oxidase superfamily flavin-nucleotide-binding protein